LVGGVWKLVDKINHPQQGQKINPKGIHSMENKEYYLGKSRFKNTQT
jgi:hypothetical protein